MGYPENGKWLIPQSPRCEVGRGREMEAWKSSGQRWILPCAAQGTWCFTPMHSAGLFAFLLWLLQVWAQQVTQTRQSPTSQSGLSCWVGLDPLSLIPNSLPRTQRSWCDRTQAKLTLRRPPTPAPLLTVTFNGHQWPRVRTARIPPSCRMSFPWTPKIHPVVTQPALGSD